MAQPTATAPISRVIESPTPAPAPAAAKAVVGILTAVSACHLLNDMIQSLLPSIYPILKVSFHLDFGQIGMITLVYQIVASLLQPFIGLYTDRRPDALCPGGGHVLHAGGDSAAGHGVHVSRCCCWPRPWWAPARPSSIRSRRGLRASPRAASTDSPNRSSRWAAIPARPSDRCWLR